MKKLVKKAFFSSSFWISSGLFVLCSFITLNANLKIDNVYELAKSNLDMFYYGVMTFNIVINSIAPFFAIIAASPIIFEEKHSIDKPKSFICSGLIGGLVFLISEIIILFILSIIYPPTFQLNIDASGTFQIFSHNIALYFSLFFINSFLIGCFYSMLSFSIYIDKKNFAASTMIPFLIYNARLYYPFKNTTIYDYLPIDTFDVASKGRSIESHIISLLFIGFLAIGIYIYKTKINKRSNDK